jgi:FKBP-type peptidyl-prolyl cis-trans isomerase
MRFLLSLIIIIIVFQSCESDGFLFTKNNKIKYQLLELSIDETALKNGDFVDFSLKIFTKNDEQVIHFPDSTYRVQLIENEPCSVTFKEMLLELKKGDSAVFYCNAEEFFKCQKWSLPVDLDPKEEIKIHIKVLEVASELAVLNAKKKQQQLLDSLAVKVDSIIIEWNKTADTIIKYENMYIALEDSCQGFSIEKGNKVKIVHQTITMDGKLIENSTVEEPFEFIAGQQDQVIDGLRIAIGYMCFGQHAKIIIPHQYSFSESFRNQMGIYKEPIICNVHLLPK